MRFYKSRFVIGCSSVSTKKIYSFGRFGKHVVRRGGISRRVRVFLTASASVQNRRLVLGRSPLRGLGLLQPSASSRWLRVCYLSVVVALPDSVLPEQTRTCPRLGTRRRRP